MDPLSSPQNIERINRGSLNLSAAEKTEPALTLVESLDFKVEVQEGDTRLSILEKALANSSRFNKLDEASKIYITTRLAEKSGKTDLKIGEKVYFSEPPAELGNIFAEALNLTSEDKRRLLDMKLKLEAPVPESMVSPREVPPPPPAPAPIPAAPIKEALAPTLASLAEDSDIARIPKREKDTPPKSEMIHSMADDNVSALQIEVAMKNGINDIYGTDGFLGLGGKDGAESKEWRFISQLPATPVLEYYSKAPANPSTLPQDILEVLSKSEKHINFINQINHLIEQSNGTLKPYERENVEGFLRRLVGFTIKRL